MRRRTIAEETLSRQALKLRTQGDWDQAPDRPYDPQLWAIMLDLIYAGRLSRARRFLDEAWPPMRTGKAQFRQEFFDCQLRRSLYWPQIAAMNNTPDEAPSPTCPPCPECG